MPDSLGMFAPVNSRTLWPMPLTDSGSRVVVFGPVDLRFPTPENPENVGWQGLYQAVAAARMGAPVILGGWLSPGLARTFRTENRRRRELIDFLRSEQINLHDIPENPNSIAADLRLLKVGPGDVVITVLGHDKFLAESVAVAAKTHGATTIFCAGPRTERMGQIPDVDVIIMNKSEFVFHVFATKNNPVATELLRTVERFGSRLTTDRKALITLGSEGSLVVSNEGTQLRPAIRKRQFKDSLGAGDCQTGALAAGLAAGRAFDDALARAEVAAALSVEQVGAPDSFPYSQDVDRRLYELSFGLNP